MMINQARRLTQALMVSGALNIALLTLFFYWMVKENPPTTYYQLKLAEEKQQHPPIVDECTCDEIICEYKKMPYDQLVTKLNHSQLIENGYTRRDVALACLTSFHYFDLNKVVNDPISIQKRTLSYVDSDGKRDELTIYRGLKDQQFQSIMHFAATEKWPLTSKGLFWNLQRKEKEDPSLADAFYLTPEFLALETLFKRSSISIDKKQLLDVVLEGDWDLIFAFSEQQKVSQDLSAAKRQRFLLDLIAQRSKKAAYLLLKTDGAFAARKLDDRSVIFLLNLVDNATPEAKAFALELLSSPRSDDVLRFAATRLYEFAGEAVPAAYSHGDALSHFLPKSKVCSQTLPTRPPLVEPKLVASAKSSPSQANPKPIKKEECLYVVQEGDSLWKISRRYKVDVNNLRAYNHLSSDFLKPGTTLRIP